MERINLLELLRKSKGYDMALFTTFNFELSFFERSILNKLFDNGIFQVSLFVDGKELIKALDGVINSYIGKRYMVTPIFMNASFHPKVILLLGKTKARLFVGSGNLITSGYYNNNEIGNVFDYDIKDEKYLNVIQASMQFFININKISDYRDARLFEKIESYSYYKKGCSTQDVYFLSNLDAPIIEQVKHFIQDEVQEIDVAVPYYDRDLLALNSLKDISSNGKVQLFVQNKKSTFPVAFKDLYPLNIYETFVDNASNHFYHGKVFRFVTNNRSYVLYGSANCTKAALFKSFNNGGNVECCMLVSEENETYNFFFANFAVDSSLQLESQELKIEENSEIITSSFLYLRNIGNLFYFKCDKKYENLVVKIGEIFLDYHYTNDECVVTISLDVLHSLDDIFAIQFIIDEEIKLVNCYYIDEDALEENRNQALSDKIFNINITPDIDAPVDKYLKDRMELITKFGMMYDIFNEQLDYYIKEDVSFDSELQEEMEDFIDYDFKLSDEVEVKRKNIEQIIKAKQHIFISFRNYLLNLSDSSGEKCSSKMVEGKGTISRSATSDEISFARLVKKIVKDMLKKGNVRKLDFSNYLTNIISVFEIFNKFMIREHVKDMFKEEEVISMQYDLIAELSLKLNDEITDEEKDMFLWLSFACILQVYYINNHQEKVDYKKNIVNKNLLKTINERFHIRDHYEKYLDVAVAFINEGVNKLDKNMVLKYIEELFDYKTSSQLNDFINKEFGSNVLVTYEEGNLFIYVETENIIFKCNMVVIEAIRKFYKNNYMKLNTILIEIKNTKKYDNAVDSVEMISFLFDEGNKKSSRKIIYKSGRIV